MKNYYDILGVRKDATREEIIQKADKIANRPMGKEEMYDFCKAFETLVDDKTRAEYNNKLEQEEALKMQEIYDDINETKETTEQVKSKVSNLTVGIASFLAGAVLVGGVSALIKNHSKNEASQSEMPEVIEEIEEANQIKEIEQLTAENFEENVNEILTSNEEKGLTTTRELVETSLILSNLEDFTDEDLNQLMDVENVKMQDKLNEYLAYVSAVENHNLNNYNDLSKHIALSDLSHNKFDYAILAELDTTYLDLMNVLQLDIVENADELNAKYEVIREKLNIKDDNEEDLVIKPTEDKYITDTLTYVEKFIVGDGGLKLEDDKTYAKQNINNYGTGILVESYAQVIGDMIREKEENMIPEYQNLINTINSNTNGLYYINGIYGYTLPTPTCQNQKTLTK